MQFRGNIKDIFIKYFIVHFHLLFIALQAFFFLRNRCSVSEKKPAVT